MFSKQYSFSTTQCLSEHSCYTNSSNWSTTPHKRLERWNWASFSLKNEIDQFLRLVDIFDFVFDIVSLRNGVKHTLDLNYVTSVRMSTVWNTKFWTQRIEYNVTWVALSDVIDQNVTRQLTRQRNINGNIRCFGSSKVICTKSIKQR